MSSCNEVTTQFPDSPRIAKYKVIIYFKSDDFDVIGFKPSGNLEFYSNQFAVMYKKKWTNTCDYGCFSNFASYPEVF